MRRKDVEHGKPRKDNAMAAVSAARFRTPHSWIVLAIFLLLVTGIGALVGTQSAPDSWYQALVKPPLNPPDWVFGVVWPLLYVFIAIAGWRIWMLGANTAAMALWGAQMLLNWAWSPIWFGAHQPWLAFAVLVAIWLCILGFILVARKRDGLAAGLFLPYLAWVSFAGYLNLSIAVMN